MKLRTNLSRAPAVLVGAVLLGGMALGLGACGKYERGLEQPAPLFGERAKEDYNARQAARSAQTDAGHGAVPAADQPDPRVDNAPRTTRDLKDPAQLNQTIDRDPIQGTVDPNGPRPSLAPPGQ